MFLRWYLIFSTGLLVMLTCCAPSVRYSAEDEKPVLRSEASYSSSRTIEGRASYYGKEFNGRKTANGEVFDMYGKTAAHRELPFDSILKVTNKKNNRSVFVRVNDRGPFKTGRILDLSYGAAREIGMIDEGVADVTIEIIHLGEDN
jgi:rare lipoprotein A (peptidoglycan hydrolase)